MNRPPLGVSPATVIEARYELGPEAVSYLRSYLASNARFGRRLGALLAHRNLEEGSIWAFFPGEPSPLHRRNFEVGGLYLDVCPSLYEPGSDPSSGADLDEWEIDPDEEWIAAALSVSGTPQRVFCVDNCLIRTSDITQDPSHRLLFCGEDVYEYALPGELRWEMVSLAGGATWQPNVGIITSEPSVTHSVPWGERISPETLEQMAMSAVAIIVGAWDGEGHMIWEPGDSFAERADREDISNR